MAFVLAVRFVNQQIGENIGGCSPPSASRRCSLQTASCQYANNRNWILGVAIGAIFLTTSVMSLLEPCLPLWLMETMKPEVNLYIYIFFSPFKNHQCDFVLLIIEVATWSCFYSRQLRLFANHTFPRWCGISHRSMESGHVLHDNAGYFLHIGENKLHIFNLKKNNKNKELDLGFYRYPSLHPLSTWLGLILASELA